MRCTGELPNPGVTPPLIGRLQLCIQFQRFLSLLKGLVCRDFIQPESANTFAHKS